MRTIALALLTILTCHAPRVLGQDPGKGADDPQVVAELRKLGVTLVQDHEQPLRPVVHVTISAKDVIEIDEAMARLVKLPHLRELTLSGVALTSSDRKHLGFLKIRTLNLLSTEVSKADLEAFDALKELRSLDLRGSVLARLEDPLRLKTPWTGNLQELKLEDRSAISHQFSLEKMDRLERLEIHFTNDDYNHHRRRSFEIARLPQLKHLVLTFAFANKGAWLGLDRLKNLESLALIDNGARPLGGQDLERLKGLAKLKRLALLLSARTEYQDDTLTKLWDLSEIEDLTLGLPGKSWDIDGVLKMSKLRKLTLIHDSDRRVGLRENTFAKFPKMLPALRELRFIGGRVDVETLDKLRVAMPTLRIVGTVARVQDEIEFGK
ncbi:MAG TPA: hypothetical protein VFE62_10405 [Gemmataceae bacterium]|nr:hypothetical protein [Gemmataceae bacterium]